MGGVEVQSRDQILAAARRVVVKVGSSSLTTTLGGLDPSRVDALVDAIAEAAAAGRREVILVSSGAIAAGLAPLGLRTRPRDLATQQAAASVGQGLLMRAYTESFGRHAPGQASIAHRR
jgi:glutamate 5-kinase